jgi:hypothetical protein
VDNIDNKKDTNKMPLQDIIDGSILTKREVIDSLPYIFFLTLLAILYIGNRYNAEKIVRNSIEIQKELKELRSESITSASRLMFISKQSEVVKLVEKNNLGLKEAVEPPRKLIVYSNE